MLLLQYFDTLRPTRLILTFHGSEIHRLASRRLLRWSTNHLLRKATHVSVVSAYAKDLFSKKFPAAATKVVLTPGALRTDLAPAAPIEEERSRKLKKRVVILTVARINPRKGQLQVIQALKALAPEQRVQVEYWLVGSHSKEGYDSILTAATLNADFHVKFLGDISDEKLGAIYQQADIFAMTSMPHKHSVEGFGLVYLEAGAHGLPVIAHDIGGVPEAVVHEETGLLVQPGDTPALTAAFSRLISDATLRHRLGTAGRVRASQSSWHRSALSLFGQAATESTS
jgi:glycosyltransferase involved in cell wall biosynthesis